MVFKIASFMGSVSHKNIIYKSFYKKKFKMLLILYYKTLLLFSDIMCYVFIEYVFMYECVCM